MESKGAEDERRTFLLSLTEVGPSKPVGYLPLYTIKDFVQLSPEAVAATAAARGLATAQFGPDISCIKSGALYVYALDPDCFVEHIATVWYTEEHPAHPIIASAFGYSG